MSFILEYGKPGTGKTTLASTMTKLGYKILFLDVDNKIPSMVNLEGLVESGQIVVQPIQAKLTQTSLRERILTPQKAFHKRPTGYLEYCDQISDLEAYLTRGEPHPCQVLVTDSLTSLLEHLNRLISSQAKKDHWTYDEWAILLTNLEEYFYTMLNLTKLFKHVIVIAHEQTIVEEETGRVTDILPAVAGSMRNKIGKYFEEIYYTHVRATKDGAQYFVTTKPINKGIARTSRNLDTIVEADFSIIFAEEMKK